MCRRSTTGLLLVLFLYIAKNGINGQLSFGRIPLPEKAEPVTTKKPDPGTGDLLRGASGLLAGNLGKNPLGIPNGQQGRDDQQVCCCTSSNVCPNPNNNPNNGGGGGSGFGGGFSGINPRFNDSAVRTRLANTGDGDVFTRIVNNVSLKSYQSSNYATM